MIEQIQISEWRQFGTLTIDFDRKLTILTGANGSGNRKGELTHHILYLNRDELIERRKEKIENLLPR